MIDVFFRLTLIAVFLFASPAVAEDRAGTILYSRLTGGHWQIWRYDVATGQAAAVTTSPTDKRMPAFGPDGAALFRTNNDELRQVAADGVESPTWQALWPVSAAAWSAAAKRWAIARIRTDIPDAGNVWLAAPGAEPRLLTDAVGLQLNPSWSPDGHRLAYSGGHGIHTYELYTVAADGGTLVRLTKNVYHEFFPAWSPDGQWLAYSADHDGDFNIWLMRADGSDAHRLTEAPGLDSRPAWSPDGRRIAFTSRRRGLLEIWVMDRDGSHQQPLIAGEAEACDPAWQ